MSARNSRYSCSRVVGPLREPLRASIPGGFIVYPNNIGGETPHTAMADQITSLSIVATGQDLITVHSIVGVGAQPLIALQPGGATNSYVAALWEGNIIADRARAAGKTFGYGAIVMTHGESDSNNAAYGPQLYDYWTAYNRDLRAITAQTAPIPMLLSQQSSVPWPTAADAGVPNPERSASTLAQWRIGVDHPGEIVCVGPKYQYAPSAYVIHLTPEGYRRLGIKYAQVFYEVAIRHLPWAPLQPTRAQRAGRTITLDFQVPVGPMQFDANIPAPHRAATLHPQWSNGHGFEVADSTGDLSIESVQIMGDRVMITLTAEPTGTALFVRYAMTPEHNGFGNGPITGRRGQLRDSDPFVGMDQQTMRCQVTNGSTAATVAPMMSIATVGARDIVTGAGLAVDTIVQSVVPPLRLTMTRPWSAPTGMYDITSEGRGIRVAALNASAVLTTTLATGGFIQIDRGSLITGAMVPAGLTVASVDAPTQLVLSSAWTGPTGLAELTFRSDQRNYCVQFEMPVP